MTFSISCNNCKYHEEIPEGVYPIPKARAECPRCKEMTFPKMPGSNKEKSK